ncbi:MAG TPA: hypothetical protein VF534_17830 [Paraburkholderia sp.]
MKIVINACYGGFSISKKAAEFMAERGSERARRELEEHAKPLDPDDRFDAISIKYGKERTFHGYGYVDGLEGRYERDDPLLVAAVETLGEEAGGSYTNLKIVEIPDDVEWEIDEYDGFEHIAEKHRTWG